MNWQGLRWKWSNKTCMWGVQHVLRGWYSCVDNKKSQSCKKVSIWWDLLYDLQIGSGAAGSLLLTAIPSSAEAGYILTQRLTTGGTSLLSVVGIAPNIKWGIGRLCIDPKINIWQQFVTVLGRVEESRSLQSAVKQYIQLRGLLLVKIVLGYRGNQGIGGFEAKRVTISV
jgi:hypothetical protein